MVKALICDAGGHGFESNHKPFLIFFLNFMLFQLGITFSAGIWRNFFLIYSQYKPRRSYHINKKFRLSPALFPILLSKSCIFSPKNLRFFSVQIFWVVLAKNQCYQIDPWASAVAPRCQTQKIWSDF